MQVSTFTSTALAQRRVPRRGFTQLTVAARFEAPRRVVRARPPRTLRFFTLLLGIDFTILQYDAVHAVEADPGLDVLPIVLPCPHPVLASLSRRQAAVEGPHGKVVRKIL